ncbi:MAG: glycine zipper 2TM domain-containing protein [Pseudomonadales bacterium]
MSVLRYIAPILLVPSLAVAGTSVDRARVVGVEPVYRTFEYSVPVQECRLVEMPVRFETGESHGRSFTGPIVGAIIGGAIGNAVGHNKTNKKVGTVVGAVLGGSIGRDISRSRDRGYHERRAVSYETEEVCETVYETEQRRELDGYDVTYRYAGQTHTTRMEHDPGKYVRVRVNVTPV